MCFDINSNLFFIYNARVVNQFYRLNSTTKSYDLTPENTKYYHEYGLQLSGYYKSLKNNIIVLKALIRPTAQKILLNDGISIENNYIGNLVTFSNDYKSFNIQYQINIPVYRLQGAF